MTVYCYEYLEMSNKPTKAESADGATVEDAVHPPATAPIMSKNQQKKMAKLQRFEAVSCSRECFIFHRAHW